MVQFVYDTFTDTAGTDLTAHTGETGATWTADAGNFVLDGNGDVYRAGTTGSNSAAPSGKPANNEQDVKLQFVRVTDTNDFLGAYARWDQPTVTGYISYFTQSGSHTYVIGKYVNGTFTQLGSKATTLTAGSIYDATFEVRPAAKRILFGTTEWLSVTDDTITQTGEVRLYGYGANTATTGCQVSVFEALDTTVAATGLDLTAGVGASTLAGHAASITTGMALTGSVGASTLAGYAASLSVDLNLTASVGNSALAGHDASLTGGMGLSANVGPLTLGGHPASLAVVTTFAASNAGDSTLAGHTAALTTGMVLTPGVGATSLAGYAASVTTTNDLALVSGIGDLALVGEIAAISGGVAFAPTVGALSLSGIGASFREQKIPGLSSRDAIDTSPSAVRTLVASAPSGMRVPQPSGASARRKMKSTTVVQGSRIRQPRPVRAQRVMEN